MIVTTTENIPDNRRARTLGQVFGVVVPLARAGRQHRGEPALHRGRRDSRIHPAPGGKPGARQSIAWSAYATAMGANAVVMMRFDSSEIGQTMSEIVAYGTAVVIEPEAGGAA